MPFPLVVSCEHGSNHVPRELRRYFRGQYRLLSGHLAYDRGALSLAHSVARRFRAPMINGSITRLVVDLNRSLTHPHIFSQITRGLDAPTRERILECWYRPYRQEVRDRLDEIVGSGRSVLHLSVHSFTPVLAGSVRNADLGLLYDPKRIREREFCRLWREYLRGLSPELRVRCNYPYRGVADGFPTFLRRHYVEADYLGVELELNQRWTRRRKGWKKLESRILATLGSVLEMDR